MKDNYTDITMVLDRSGSMESVKADTIGGFNSFVHDQQAVPGEATITVVQFDDQYDVLYEGVKIQEARKLNEETFVPRGNTALLDAIGRTITATGARLKKMDEKDRPAKALFVVITDGMENASKMFSRAQVFDMIKHQQDAYSWEFVFIGSNQDAITTAQTFNIRASNAMSNVSNAKGMKAMYRSLSKNTEEFRIGADVAGNKVSNFCFKAADYAAQKEAEPGE